MDQVVEKKGLKKSITEAELVLPTDRWVTNGGPFPSVYNDSQWQRELGLVKAVIQEVQPWLKTMSVPDLVESLRLEADLPASTRGFHYWLYVEGNRLIVQELRTRRPGDLDFLERYKNDMRPIVESLQGPNLSIGTVCQEILQQSARNRK
jgi:hypothetical protein